MPILTDLESKVLSVITRAQAKGLTCSEVETKLKMSHQTASARVNALRDKKEIVDSGQTRKTTSGRSAIVWVIPNYGPEEPPQRAKRETKGTLQASISELVVDVLPLLELHDEIAKLGPLDEVAATVHLTVGHSSVVKPLDLKALAALRAWMARPVGD